MPNYAMPGMDGFPSEYFKLFSGRTAKAAGTVTEDGSEEENPFLVLLTEALVEAVIHPEGMPHQMRDVVISLIYKEKGDRALLKNYRPIAVMPALYKILTRTMAEALHGVLPWLVDNTGFQHGVDTHDNARLVQDTIHYLEQSGRGGLLVLCDQKSAYPRVQWDFLQEVMSNMGIHADFRSMVTALYRDPAVRIKVNGHIGDPFTPRHGLHQGCGLSPLLYLLCLQTFTSLVARDPLLRGVRIPDSSGSDKPEHRREVRVNGYADDLSCFLQDEMQLPRFKTLLAVPVYEKGRSGAQNEWEKTHAFRFGTLKTSTVLPDGWEHPGIFDADVVRYLGIFLGVEERVAREWEARTTAKIRGRYASWLAQGGPKTLFGRNDRTPHRAIFGHWPNH